jgi:ubiquinone/menaquinone biosynthesis C-methylase UbiE
VTEFRCPACGGELEDFVCHACGERYEVADGIPQLVAGIDDFKRRQVAHFEDEDAEFEIERPRGTTPLYEWLIDEKFKRSVRGLESMLAGATALTVCGGSGMEAELLVRAGAQVVCSDLSPGAVRRARERARRHGFELTAVVADAERLPFADRSFDLVYVHDGLHHLERPDAALAEMARVARRAVSVSEPARAAVTRVAVQLGVAHRHEEAGNPVRRLELDRIAAELRTHGFDVVHAERYGLFYRHHPGAASRVFSRVRLFPLATTVLRAANALAGRVGNKLTVQAVRSAG